MKLVLILCCIYACTSRASDAPLTEGDDDCICVCACISRETLAIMLNGNWTKYLLNTNWTEIEQGLREAQQAATSVRIQIQIYQDENQRHIQEYEKISNMIQSILLPSGTHTLASTGNPVFTGSLVFTEPLFSNDPDVEREWLELKRVRDESILIQQENDRKFLEKQPSIMEIMCRVAVSMAFIQFVYDRLRKRYASNIHMETSTVKTVVCL